MTASTSSTLRPTTAGTLVAGFPRGRFSASPGTRVLSFSRASSTTSPADALRGSGPLGAREGAGDVAAGRIERSARPLPVAGAGLDQAAQRLVCGAAPRAVLDGHLIARQADRPVDVADGTGPASSRTPYPAAEQAGPQVLRAPVAAALSSPPPDPLPGLAAALRGLTHEAARFPQLIIIIYDQIPDRRRGRGFATGIHLNEALEWSKRPGPPQIFLRSAALQPFWLSSATFRRVGACRVVGVRLRDAVRSSRCRGVGAGRLRYRQVSRLQPLDERVAEPLLLSCRGQRRSLPASDALQPLGFVLQERLASLGSLGLVAGLARPSEVSRVGCSALRPGLHVVEVEPRPVLPVALAAACCGRRTVQNDALSGDR